MKLFFLDLFSKFAVVSNTASIIFAVLLITDIILHFIFYIQWYPQVLPCLLKTLYQFVKYGTDSMMHWTNLQLYSAKAFAEEVSGP